MVDILPDQETKVKWLLTRLVEFQAGKHTDPTARCPRSHGVCVAGSVLIFATRKTEADYLYKDLTTKGQDGIVNRQALKPRLMHAWTLSAVLLLHGDFHQQKRDEVVAKFKRQECRVLVATDVAGECSAPTGAAAILTRLRHRSWSGHPVSPHRHQLLACSRHRHAHASHWPNRPRW